MRLRSLYAVVFVGLALLSGCGRSSTSSDELPPIAAAPVTNAELGVGYIGAKRCAECHREQEASYHHTAHSQALAEIDLDAEPPDGEFSDSISQRHYRIYRQDGALRQEESIRTSTGEPLVLCDLPVRYVIGSGRFSRSYLIDRDGFLFESPATWYAEPKEWKLSPGYETGNLGFQRPAELRCLVCHAGRVEPVERSPHRVALSALAIDCERCHGPGELHARKWEGTVARNESRAEHDDTIFNPARFDRQLGEDVCAQCHLHSAATVELRGRRLLDFRPGRKLADYLAHFAPKSPKTEMKVVGHVEQLRLSRCYQADTRMTCLTCHDPHDETPLPERAASHRERCLNCHTEQSCRAPAESRQAPSVRDNCVQCHMPTSATEIPHFAFTHHRIGIHKDATAAEESADLEELVPLPGSPSLPSREQLRNRGLGYLQYSDATKHMAHVPEYRSRAEQLLLQFKRKGGKDAEVDAALARLQWGVDPQQLLRNAQAVVVAKDKSPEAWATACFTLGTTYYELSRPTEARPWLERTLTLRPNAEVYYMLSDCLDFSGETVAAVEAARRACELSPDRPRYVDQLIHVLKKSGNVAEVEALQSRYDELVHYRRRVDPPQ